MNIDYTELVKLSNRLKAEKLTGMEQLKILKEIKELSYNQFQKLKRNTDGQNYLLLMHNIITNDCYEYILEFSKKLHIQNDYEPIICISYISPEKRAVLRGTLLKAKKSKETFSGRITQLNKQISGFPGKFFNYENPLYYIDKEYYDVFLQYRSENAGYYKDICNDVINFLRRCFLTDTFDIHKSNQ